MVLGQLLCDEGCAAIGVVLPRKFEHCVAECGRIASIAWLTTSLGDQSGRTLGTVSTDEAVDLALAESEERRRSGAGQAMIDNALQYVDPKQLPVAYCQRCHGTAYHYKLGYRDVLSPADCSR